MSEARGDEELRALERATSVTPGAESFGRFARALARAGQPDDAQRAALRALEHDPGSAVRELLFPPPLPGAPANSVEWRGLRTLGRPRALERAPRLAMSGPSPRDLGAGRFGYGTAEGFVAVDVLAGEVVWRVADPVVGTEKHPLGIVGVVPTGVVLTSGRPATPKTLRVLDARTGLDARPGRLFPGSPASVHWLDAETLVAVEELEHEADAGGEAPLHFTMIDFESWDVVGELVLGESRQRKWYTSAAGILVAYPCTGEILEDLVGFDRSGRQLWTHPVDSDFLGVVDGLVILGDRTGALETLDPRTGVRRAAGKIPFVQLVASTASDRVLIVESSAILALDRRSLGVCWERRDVTRVRQVLATADSVLVHARGAIGTGLPPTLRALNPKSGEELAMTEIPSDPSALYVNPTLVAGHVVLFRNSDEAPVIAVGER